MTVTIKEIERLTHNIRLFAERHGVTRVPSYPACIKLLGTIRYASGASSKFAQLRRARQHYHIMRAAAIEKATRGKA